MEKPRTAKQWQNIIEMCMRNAGTYKDYFVLPVKTLAGILEKRDRAEKFLEDTGGEILVEHVNQGGNVYIEQNPAVRLINDLNRDALTYMRECGITPKGLKQITESLQTEAPEDPLVRVLEELEKELTEYDEDGDPVVIIQSIDKDGNIVETRRKMEPHEVEKHKIRGGVKPKKWTR